MFTYKVHQKLQKQKNWFLNNGILTKAQLIIKNTFHKELIKLIPRKLMNQCVTIKAHKDQQFQQSPKELQLKPTDHNLKDKRFTKQYSLQEQTDFQESTIDTQTKDGLKQNQENGYNTNDSNTKTHQRRRNMSLHIICISSPII